MKRAVYSFVLILLMSCGAAPRESRLVSVYLLDGRIFDGKLMSVKDNIVEIDLINLPSDTMSARMKMPFSEVDHIFLPRDEVLNPVVVGCTSGCIAGSGIGYGLNSKRSDNTLGMVFTTTFGGILGAVVGGVIGCEIQHNESNYYVHIEKDLEYLKTVAVEK